MAAQLDQLIATNSARPADWRLQLAKLAAEGDKPAVRLSRADPIVQGAVRVIRGDGVDEVMFAALLKCEALQILGAEFEARVVAGQPTDELAAAMGISEDVAALTEALAFDVRGRTQTCPGLNLPVSGQTISQWDMRGLLILAAMELGVESVDQMLKYFEFGLNTGIAIKAVPGLSAEDRRRMKEIRGWIKAKTRPEGSRPANKRSANSPITAMKALLAAQNAERRAARRQTTLSSV